MATGYPAAFVFTFSSQRFDPDADPENPFGGAPGHGVLTWLGSELEALGYPTSGAPQPEDWGWYLRADAGGHYYDVGAARQADRDRNATRWLVQVRKQHTLWHKLRGRNRMQVDEPLPRAIERILREADGLEDLVVDHEDV
jgi:hypothetical protein